MARTKSVTQPERPGLATRVATGPFTPDGAGSKRPRAQSPKQGGKSKKKTNTTERSRSPKSTKGAQKKGKASATSRDAAMESPKSPPQYFSPRLKANAAKAKSPPQYFSPRLKANAAKAAAANEDKKKHARKAKGSNTTARSKNDTDKDYNKESDEASEDESVDKEGIKDTSTKAGEDITGGGEREGGNEKSDKDSDEESKKESADVVGLEEQQLGTKPSNEKSPSNLLIDPNTLPISTPKGKTTTPIPILTPPNKSSKAVKEAWQCIQRHCGTSICSINNTMWLYLWPLYVNSEGELVVSNLDCNWNVWNDKLGLEITLNILRNADGTHTKLHAPFAGHDMTILMANDEQVRLCNYLHFVYFYKILFSSLTFVSCGKSVIRVYSYCPPNVSLVIIQSLIWHKRRPQHTLIYIRTLYLIVLILCVPRPGGLIC